MLACYTSCGCNRTAFAADWGQNDLLAYGACKAVAICQTKSPTRILSMLTGHKERVNCVRWIRKKNQNHEPERELVSASTDKTAIIWTKNGKQFEATAKLEGHTNTVTVATGIYVPGTRSDQGSTRTLVATASVDSTVKIWERTCTAAFTCVQTISFGSGFALDLSWILLPETNIPLLACGGDDQKLHLLAEQDNKFVSVQTLSGHEDWIRGVEFAVEDSGDLLLASCAQDYYIRIWRLSSRDPETTATQQFIGDLPLDVDIRMKETTFNVTNKDKNHCYAVTLESVLQGHENWIYSIRWHPPVSKDGSMHQPMALLSASMDKTMILWRPDDETGLWVEDVRVGDVGGKSLGFYGAIFSPDGKSILSHGYQGAFCLWTQHEDSSTWLPGVTIGGHFAGVEDLAWDPEKGSFLVSTSLDQTTRLHGYWKATKQEESTWHEIARPQVHGYDIQCLTMIDRWRFASGADEKVIRAFEAPRNFMENLGRLCGVDIHDSLEARGESSAPEGARVPPLGLSNKAIFQGMPDQPLDDREIISGYSNQYQEVYFSPLTLNAPPSEDNLLQNTLWPEIQKLYGHGYEIFALACNPSGTLLASTCKAAKAEHAALLIWDVASWRQVCRLESHSLTVTQLVFSHSGEHLLSVSRDRTWSIYCQRQNHQPESDPLFSRVAFTDKKTSIHTRIIWGAAWSHDDLYFITVSRDKKAILWARNPEASAGDSSLGGYGACSVPLNMADSITAVDFSPVKSKDGCYIVAFGLDNGCIYVYKWSDALAKDPWKQVIELNQSSAHHMTVKRLKFRPVVGEISQNTTDTSNKVHLASCGADHCVRIYIIDLDVL